VSRSRYPRLEMMSPFDPSCAKSLFFCETQHRQVAALRKSAPNPLVEMHPSTAETRGIKAGDWVSLETPLGSVRARAKLNATLDPQVVFGQHGWWEACDELGLPGYPPYGTTARTSTSCCLRHPAIPSVAARPCGLVCAKSRRPMRQLRKALGADPLSGTRLVPAHAQGAARTET
jgi:hypothetical protein